MSDLDFRIQGRAAKPVECEIVRELTGVDLALLDAPRESKPSSIKKLRDAHHNIARLLAQGLGTTEVAEHTGYSISRVSILQADPAFIELVAFYRKHVAEVAEEVLTDATVKMTTVRNEIIEELHDRLSEAPETIPTDTLLDALKVTADRTGMGPMSKSLNAHVHVDLADRIAAGRRRVAQLGASPAPAEEQKPVAVQVAPPRDGEAAA